MPIRIGDVTLSPGDCLLADRDGAIRLPRAQAAATATEHRVRTAILDGVDPQEAYCAMVSSDPAGAVSRDPRLLLLNAGDNVLVARGPIGAGEQVLVDGHMVRLGDSLRLGHKLARRAIADGEAVVKYGAPIGYATAAIPPGAHVHLHNVRSGYTASVALEGDAAPSGAPKLAGSDGPGPFRAGNEP